MKNIWNRERLISIICLIFASWIYYEGGQFPRSALDNIGPALYPRFLAIVIGVSSLILLFTSNGTSAPLKGKREFISLGYLLLSTILYLLVMPRIGFLISTTLFLLAMTLFFDHRQQKVKLRAAIPYSIIFSVSMYIFFGRLLGVLLPGFALAF